MAAKARFLAAEGCLAKNVVISAADQASPRLIKLRAPLIKLPALLIKLRAPLGKLCASLGKLCAPLGKLRAPLGKLWSALGKLRASPSKAVAQRANLPDEAELAAGGSDERPTLDLGGQRGAAVIQALREALRSRAHEFGGDLPVRQRGPRRWQFRSI